MAVLGLHCCAQAFSSCSEWELCFIAVQRHLIVMASLVVPRNLQPCPEQEGPGPSSRVLLPRDSFCFQSFNPSFGSYLSNFK